MVLIFYIIFPEILNTTISKLKKKGYCCVKNTSLPKVYLIKIKRCFFFTFHMNCMFKKVSIFKKHCLFWWKIAVIHNVAIHFSIVFTRFLCLAFNECIIIFFHIRIWIRRNIIIPISHFRLLFSQHITYK